MKSAPLAAVDLGTNTARLLIAYLVNGEIGETLLLKRCITRLGGGFNKEHGLSPEAVDRAMAALHYFRAEMDRFHVFASRAVATSAVRDAANGKEFVDAVCARTGICLDIIDGREEGLLTLAGVLSAIDDKAGDFLVFDVGGGSTEYTFAAGKQPLITRSLPLGVVRLTEGKVEPAAMVDKIERELSPLRVELEGQGLGSRLAGATLVGTAGTATTLAAISLGMTDYDYRLVNNHLLSRSEIEGIYHTLVNLSPAARLAIPGMEKGREDLIIAGILITLKTMEILAFDSLKVSDFGLLEGILLCFPDDDNRRH